MLLGWFHNIPERHESLPKPPPFAVRGARGLGRAAGGAPFSGGQPVGGAGGLLVLPAGRAPVPAQHPAVSAGFDPFRGCLGALRGGGDGRESAGTPGEGATGVGKGLRGPPGSCSPFPPGFSPSRCVGLGLEARGPSCRAPGVSAVPVERLAVCGTWNLQARRHRTPARAEQRHFGISYPRALSPRGTCGCPSLVRPVHPLCPRPGRGDPARPVPSLGKASAAPPWRGGGRESLSCFIKEIC